MAMGMEVLVAEEVGELMAEGMGELITNGMGVLGMGKLVY